MKKVLNLILLLIAISMAGCFSQEKEKQEEKVVEAEKAVTKSSPVYSGVRIVLEQENKYYDITQNNSIVIGQLVTPTKDTNVKMYAMIYNYMTNEHIYGYEIVEGKLLKGKTYFIYCGQEYKGGSGSGKIVDVDSRYIENEKNELFKMTFDSSCMKWSATEIKGNSFKIKDTQNNCYYFNGKVFSKLEYEDGQEITVSTNKLYSVMFQEEFNYNELLYVTAEKDIEQFKVIGSLSTSDYIGYYDFYSGMKVKMTSDKNETLELPVVWNTRSNVFGIEANGLKYGTYKLTSTYQAERKGYVYGSAYGENDNVLVEYTINTTMTIDSKTVSYPLQEGGKLINIGNVAVSYKVIKNMSKNFTSLALAGVYNNWDIKGNMTFKGSNTWEGDIETKTLNNSVLFMADNSWNKKYGDYNRDNTADLNNGDIKLQFAGKYHVTFNDSTLKYTVTLLSKTDLKRNFNEIAVYGAFNNWNSKGNMSFMGEHQWQYRVTVTSNTQIKFIGDGNGSYIYGDKNKDGVAEIGGTGITLEKGAYQILFNDETLRYTLKKLN